MRVASVLRVPVEFARATARREGAAGQRWVDQLPNTVEELLQQWQLTCDGPVLHGVVALVVPVRTADDRPAVLKVSWIDDETRDEARALAWWSGRGAVPVLESAPEHGALLLARLDPHRSLLDLGEQAAVTAAAQVLRRLHVPPPPRLGEVTSTAARWAQTLPARARQTADGDRRGLVAAAVELCRDLAVGASRPVLLHGDFHYGNVLADGPATAATWVAIDPKPLVGDGEYDLLPLLRNRWSELVATGDPGGACRRRLQLLLDVTGMDAERARAWCLVRAVDNALWGEQQEDQDFAAIGWTIADAMTRGDG